MEQNFPVEQTRQKNNLLHLKVSATTELNTLNRLQAGKRLEQKSSIQCFQNFLTNSSVGFFA